jgi:type IV pilus assembly protein PilV
MVEALVALVVLSVGMLGIAGLYVSSLRANRTALIRTQAINLVNDMADRIRANSTAREAYDVGGYGATAPASHTCVVTSNCTAAQLAEDDLSRWLPSVTTTLAGTNVAGNVIYAAGAGTGLPDTYTISAGWTEAGEGATSYTSTVMLIPVQP